MHQITEEATEPACGPDDPGKKLDKGIREM